MSWLSFVLMATRREEEAAALLRRIREVASTPFYQSVAAIHLGTLALRRGHLGQAERRLREGQESGWSPVNFRCLEAAVAVRRGQTERCRELWREISASSGVGTPPLALAASARRTVSATSTPPSHSCRAKPSFPSTRCWFASSRICIPCSTAGPSRRGACRSASSGPSKRR